jgi:hypothetical protein
MVPSTREPDVRSKIFHNLPQLEAVCEIEQHRMESILEPLAEDLKVPILRPQLFRLIPVLRKN